MASTQKYNIGDKIYHIMLDSPKGFIFDVSYSFRYDEYKYLVIWTKDSETWCNVDELTTEKNIDLG